ncbi:hypothetical protein KPH14_003279 [Odynerus spinipes]|uniref:Rhodanese domain-containing protein n=1 Tax=Odynerus spinipes TaxID=1348599 RepID=A0AAD9RCD9_9HYME|nr:hypothetical protein KPH14_003279 [Odynerus spinipes]
MRYNVLRQFYNRCLITDIKNRRLHLCSLIAPTCDISERSVKNNLRNTKRTLHFSNTFCGKRETKIMSGEGDNKRRTVDYNGILQAQEDDSILIIDVREQSEINDTGKLPGSIHIPMGDVTSTLKNLSEEDFKQKFNKSKPYKNTKIILSCRSGRRSGMIQEELQKIGYEHVYNYMGGWLDWESNQK